MMEGEKKKEKGGEGKCTDVAIGGSTIVRLVRHCRHGPPPRLLFGILSSEALRYHNHKYSTSTCVSHQHVFPTKEG